MKTIVKDIRLGMGTQYCNPDPLVGSIGDANETNIIVLYNSVADFMVFSNLCSTLSIRYNFGT